MAQFSLKDLRGWKLELKLAKDSLRKFHDNCKSNVARYLNPSDIDARDTYELPGGRGKWGIPPLVARFIQTRLANLYLQEPEFSLMADQEWYVDGSGEARNTDEMARIFGAGLNHFYKSTNQAEADKEVIVHTLLSGIGMKLHGYHTTFVDAPTLHQSSWEFGYAVPYDLGNENGKAKHFHAVALGPDGKGKTTTDNDHWHRVKVGEIQPARSPGDKKEHIHLFEPAVDQSEREVIVTLFRSMEFGDRPWEYDQFVREEEPWAKPLWIQKALWDPRGASQSEWQWFGYWEWRQLADVKNFPLYKNTEGLETQYYYQGNAGGVKDVFQDVDMSREPYKPDSSDDIVSAYNTDYLKQIRVFTVFIKRDIVNPGKPDRHDKLLVFAEDYDKPLYYGDNPYDVDGYPVAIMKWLPMPNRFATLSDVSIWQELFDDYCHFRRVILDKADRKKTVHVLNKAHLQNELGDFAERFAKAEDGELLVIDAPGVTDIRQVLQTVQEPPLERDFWGIKQDLEQSIRVISGESETGMGQPVSKPKTTATEVMKFEEARSKLLSLSQYGVMNYLERSGSITMSNLQQFYTGRTMVEIVNSMGEKELREFTRREAQVRCRIQVIPESQVPADRQFRRWELMNLMQMIAGIPPLAQALPPEAWTLFLKTLLTLNRLPEIAALARAPNMDFFIPPEQRGQPVAPGAAGIENILGNITGTGQGEGGGAAVTESPSENSRLGVQASAAPNPGQISGARF